MKDEDQIKAIAEFAGFIPTEWPPRSKDGWHVSDELIDLDRRFPHYLTSLDAIVPVCDKLSDRGQRTEFVRQIYQTILNNTEEFSMVNATARQRCEALLRTLGKWTE